MNKALIGIAAAVALIGTPALAADLPLKAPVPYAEPQFSWTGCYVGVHAGGGTFSDSEFGDDRAPFGGVGAVAGGQAGCNYQIRSLVVGLEGELFWSGLKTQSNFSQPSENEIELDSAKNKYDATIALRLGYAFDRLLAYGKVGVAWGRFSWSEADACCSVGIPLFSENASQTLAGLLLGAGFEYAFTNQLSAKLEYNYMNFGSQDVTFTEACSTVGGCGTIGNFTETMKDAKQIVKVGLNYKFY
jgi:outer membrane immunogenic protein